MKNNLLFPMLLLMLRPIPATERAPGIPAGRSASESVQAQNIFDLAALIDLGLKHRPGLNARRQEALALENAYQASRKPANPELMFHLGRGESYDGEVERDTRGWTIHQPLENPFRRHYRIQARKQEWKAAEQRAAATAVDARAGIKQLYFRVLNRKRIEKLARLNLESVSEIHRLIKKRAELGEVRELEALRLEVEALQARNRWNRARVSLRLAREDLNAFLGDILPGDFEVAGELDFLPVSLDEDALIERALETHPLIRTRRSLLEAAESRIRFQRWRRLPDFNLSAFVNNELHGQIRGVGVSLTIPLWNRYSSEIRQAAHLSEKESAELQSLRIDLGRDIRAGISRLRLSRESMEIFHQGLLRQAEEGRRIAEISYREGEISLIDYLDSQRSYFSIQIEYADALLTWNADLAGLEKTIGEELT